VAVAARHQRAAPYGLDSPDRLQLLHTSRD
jgi:hypothetical protein